MYGHRRKELQYQKLTKAKGCAFCSLDDRALNPEPRTVVHRTAHMYVTVNSFPYDFWEHLQVDEHLLLVPSRHVTSMDGLAADERKDYVDILCDYESRGYSVYTRAPSNSNRTVAHIHTHLIKLSGKRPRGMLTLQKPYLAVRW